MNRLYFWLNNLRVMNVDDIKRFVLISELVDFVVIRFVCFLNIFIFRFVLVLKLNLELWIWELVLICM